MKIQIKQKLIQFMDIVYQNKREPVEKFNLENRLEDVLVIKNYNHHEKAFFTVINDFNISIQGTTLDILYPLYVESIEFIKDRHPIYSRALVHICACLLTLYEKRKSTNSSNSTEHEYYLCFLYASIDHLKYN